MIINQSYQEREERALLLRLAEGDQQAFTILYNHYQPLITKLLYPFNPPVEPPEIVQDIFYKIWLKRALMPEVKSFKSYLFRMAHNRLIDKNRTFKLAATHQRSYSAIKKDDFHSGTGDILYHELQEHARKAMQQLPERQKKILELTLLHDYSREEIARIMQLSVWVVDKDLGSATKKVRAQVAVYAKGGIA